MISVAFSGCGTGESRGELFKAWFPVYLDARDRSIDVLDYFHQFNRAYRAGKRGTKLRMVLLTDNFAIDNWKSQLGRLPVDDSGLNRIDGELVKAETRLAEAFSDYEAYADYDGSPERLAVGDSNFKAGLDGLGRADADVVAFAKGLPNADAMSVDWARGIAQAKRINCFATRSAHC